MAIEYVKFLPGKLPHNFLQQLLERYTSTGPRVLQGAKIGEDTAVIEMGDFYLLAKTDPITFVTEHIGQYAVHINANDIACMGGEPKWFLATLLLPERHSHPKLVESIFRQINQTCKKEKIAFCGGHTEVTLGLDRPIVVGQMLGEVKKEDLKLKQHVRAGDFLILAREVPIEGTAIIAREKAAELDEIYAPDLVQRCINLIHKPGLNIRPLCRIAMTAKGVHAMHDPTEGGVLTAVHEMSSGAGLGVSVVESAIPILPEGKLLCDHFGINPLGCISSGSLLIAVDGVGAASLLAAFAKAQITASQIGLFTEIEKGSVLETPRGPIPLPVFSQDEIVRILA